MAIRYIGDAVIRIQYHDAGDYRGTVSAKGYVWQFDSLCAAPCNAHGSADSEDAYDTMAAEAVSFGAYYTSDNRGDSTDAFPAGSVADAIAEATSHALTEDMRYEVRRTPRGKVRLHS